MTDVDIPLDTGDFRLLDRKVVNVMNSMPEKHRFLRGMGAWVGFKQIGVEYKRDARHAGVTKYPLKKMLKLAANAVTSFSYVPLQVATWIGFIAAALSSSLFNRGAPAAHQNRAVDRPGYHPDHRFVLWGCTVDFFGYHW